jgi:hypothetical protein
VLRGKPSPGDLVRIRPTPDLVVEAQITKVLQRNVLLVVFSAGALMDRKPILMVETMDIRLKSGEWETFGHDVLVDVPDPMFLAVVGLDGQKWVQDFEGNFLRVATPDDIPSLRIRKSFSPVAVEEAIRGVYGAAEWRPVYDAMRL